MHKHIQQQFLAKANIIYSFGKYPKIINIYLFFCMCLASWMTGADLRVEEGQASVGVTTSEGDSYNLMQEFWSLPEWRHVQLQFLFFGVLST